MAESDPGSTPEQVEERIMSFADAVKTCFRKYFDFKSRATSGSRPPTRTGLDASSEDVTRQVSMNNEFFQFRIED